MTIWLDLLTEQPYLREHLEQRSERLLVKLRDGIVVETEQILIVRTWSEKYVRVLRQVNRDY